MVVVVCVLVVAVLVVVPWCLVVVVRRMFGGSDGGSVGTGTSLPYGGLPELGPVGPLSGLRPDADVGDDLGSSDDLLGG